MKIAYLIRSYSSLPSSYKFLKTPHSDVIVSSWNGNFTPQDWFELFIHPDTTWGEGRNKLLEIAFRKNKYDYFIFMDDDLEFDIKHHIPLLETFLTHNSPSIIYPRVSWQSSTRDDIQYKNNCDASFSIFHKSIIDKLLPYYNGLQDFSWHYSQGIINVITTLALNLYRFQYNPLKFNNTQCNPYPRNWDDVQFKNFINSIIHSTYHDKWHSPLIQNVPETTQPAKIIPYKEIDLNNFLLSDTPFMEHHNKFWQNLRI